MAQDETPTCDGVRVADGHLEAEGVTVPLPEAARGAADRSRPLTVVSARRGGVCVVGVQVDGPDTPRAVLVRIHERRGAVLLDEPGSLTRGDELPFGFDDHRFDLASAPGDRGDIAVREVESVESACGRASGVSIVHRRIVWRRWDREGRGLESIDAGDAVFVDCSAREYRRVTAPRMRHPAPRGLPGELRTLVVTDAVLVPGEAPEDVELTSTGVLRAGGATGRVDLSDFDAATAFDASRVTIAARCHRADENALWVMASAELEETTVWRLQVFLRRGSRWTRALTIDGRSHGWLTTEPLELLRPVCGAGRIERLRVASDTGAPTDLAPIVRDTFVLDHRDRFRVRTETTAARFDRGHFAACPTVMIVEGGDERPIGEVLRYLGAASLEATQLLALGAVDGPVLTVLLREEKDEVTVLDDVHLVVDGIEIRPSECAERSAPYCGRDGATVSLARGEEIALRFELSSGASEIALSAHGYYVPLGPRIWVP